MIKIEKQMEYDDMTRRSLYLECYSGISGDMAVGALLDLGADADVLKSTLDSLNIGGFKIEITRVSRSGLDACDFNVILDTEHENHDHDNEYLYGRHDHNDHHYEHHHDHEDHHEYDHQHEHRGLPEIVHIIDNAKMTDNARSISKKIFMILADAEAKAHGTEIDKVHFHEVGAVDSIVDIISVAVCFDDLNISDVVVTDLYDGTGTIRCQHGIIPVPVPAVSIIAAKNGLKLHIMDVEGEYVTPTGAAVVAALRTTDKLPNEFSIERIGIGSGKRKTERSGILRAMIICSDEKPSKRRICKLECNIDDCSGESFGFALERLMDAGAKDVHYTPVYMKKNRPAYQLNVLCSEADIEKMEEIIFEETTTIGIRHVMMESTILDRKIVSVDTEFGKIDVKICGHGPNLHYYPEYESIAEMCKTNNIPYQTAYRMIQTKCVNMFENEKR